MKYRKLRIAWSLVWGVACLLLVVLWVRSYWRANSFDYQYSSSHRFLSILAQGKIYLQVEEYYFKKNTVLLGQWEIATDERFNSSTWHSLPMWIPTFLAAAATGLPWLRFRFSLRTLLIVITALALLVGVITYAMR